jgi:hypothetical protein
MDEVTFSKWRRVGAVSNMVSMDGKEMRPVSMAVRESKRMRKREREREREREKKELEKGEKIKGSTPTIDYNSKSCAGPAYRQFQTPPVNHPIIILLSIRSSSSIKPNQE